MQTQIAILSDHSIFAEGVANRLRQHSRKIIVHFIDPQQPDYVDHIKVIQPTAVIIDAAGADSSQYCLLCDLLMNLPGLTIVRLEAHKPDVQIVSSSQYQIDKAADIIDIVEATARLLGK